MKDETKQWFKDAGAILVLYGGAVLIFYLAVRFL